MLVCTLGDLMLDVLVQLDGALEPGGDVPAGIALAPGGQAANVAAWVRALGADARFVGAIGDDEHSRLAARGLAAHGVDAAGPVRAGAGGIVVSLVAPDGERTMASARPTALELEPDELDPTWLACDHLHVSGYLFSSAGGRAVAARASALAHEHGAAVSVDLAAATIVATVGRDEIRAVLAALRPGTVFCNDAEDTAVGGPVPGATWIVKHGAGGASVDGRPHAAAPAEVVDTTGAGDAFAAGWIVGGIEAALATAARCIARTGAFPALS